MCDFCSDLFIDKSNADVIFKPIHFKGNTLSGVVIKQDVTVNSELLITWKDNPFVGDDIIHIVPMGLRVQYCPSCGRKLEKRDMG